MNPKIYLLIFTDQNFHENVIGVFSTREKALKRVQDSNDLDLIRNFHIEEWELE